MLPKLVEIPAFGPFPAFPIHFYGLFLALGYFTAIAFAARRARLQGIDPAKMWDLSVWVLLSAILGSKLLLVAVDPGAAFSLRTAGVFYGGFIAATITAMWYMRRHGLPFWEVCDIAGPAIALGEGIGRIGCLTAGCCWGAETTSRIGIVFTSTYAHDVVGVPLNVRLWPTQIIHALNGFLLLAVLLLVAARRRFPGQVFWSYVLLHSITRGLIEILRGDYARGFLGPLSTSQAIAVLTGTVALVALVVMSRRRSESSPAPPSARRGGKRGGRAERPKAEPAAAAPAASHRPRT